jgi:hypothetical protein
MMPAMRPDVAAFLIGNKRTWRIPMSDSTHNRAWHRHPLRATLAAMAIAMMLLASIAFTGSSSGTMAAQDTATPQIDPPITAATPVVSTCEAIAPGTGAEEWIQTELYFGTTQEDGTELTDDEFNAFLDEEITPRFPDGLTVLTGYGQWRNAAGDATSEKSVVVIILYPADPSGETSAKIQDIREAYKTEFDQESVLRADTPGVCVSF